MWSAVLRYLKDAGRARTLVIEIDREIDGRWFAEVPTGRRALTHGARLRFRSSPSLSARVQVRASVGVHREVASSQRVEVGVPTGIRTRVSALKGPRPRPLDDGDHEQELGETDWNGTPS